MAEQVTVVSPTGDRQVVSAKAARVIFAPRGWKVEHDDASANPDPGRADTGRSDTDTPGTGRADRPPADTDGPHPTPDALTPPAGNATRMQWVIYANTLGVDVEPGLSRKDIKARLADLGHIPRG